MAVAGNACSSWVKVSARSGAGPAATGFGRIVPVTLPQPAGIVAGGLVLGGSGRTVTVVPAGAATLSPGGTGYSPPTSPITRRYRPAGSSTRSLGNGRAVHGGKS